MGNMETRNNDNSNDGCGAMNGQVAIKITPSSTRNLRGQVAIQRTCVRSARAKLSLKKTSFPNRHLRGQVATEFMLYSAVFMFIVITALVSISFIQTSEIPLREATLAKEMGQIFATSLNLAARAGPGFEYTLSFPKTILGKEYIIDFDTQNSRIALTWAATYSNQTYIYNIAPYDYALEGCISTKQLRSNSCKNRLRIYNDGKILTIRQEA